MIYRGKVTAVTSTTATVLVPDLDPRQSCGPLSCVGQVPAVDDIVLVVEVGTGGSNLPDLVVLNPVIVPIGSVSATARATAPAGWLLCAGQSLLRADYAALFSAIGTTYGAADGTHFSLPDLRGRTIAGLDNMNGTDAGRLDWANTLGTTGGTQTHTLTAAESGLPAHTHGLTSSNGSGNVLGDGTGSDANLTTGGHSYTAKTFSVDSVAAAAASSAHNNMQPTILLNYIIRAL